MNTLHFYKSFLRKVGSYLGEPARLTGPAHLHMISSLNICIYQFIAANRTPRNNPGPARDVTQKVNWRMNMYSQKVKIIIVL